MLGPPSHQMSIRSPVSTVISLTPETRAQNAEANWSCPAP
jgi:hypothetical protein